MRLSTGSENKQLICLKNYCSQKADFEIRGYLNEQTSHIWGEENPEIIPKKTFCSYFLKMILVTVSVNNL